jgi:hypothetical protein
MWRGGLGTEILGSAKSALGHKQTRHSQMVMSALRPKADIRPPDRDVCFAPKADIRACLFDHFVSNGDYARRNHEVEGFGGLEVNH